MSEVASTQSRNANKKKEIKNSDWVEPFTYTTFGPIVVHVFHRR